MTYKILTNHLCGHSLKNKNAANIPISAVEFDKGHGGENVDTVQALFYNKNKIDTSKALNFYISYNPYSITMEDAIL